MPTSAEHMDLARIVRIRWIGVILYVTLIFILSAQPGLAIPGEFELRDKLAHTVEYGGLGWLVERTTRATWPHALVVRRVLLSVIAISALGVCDELFQATVPGRDSTVYDWMADTLGAVLGQALGLVRSRRGGAA